MTTGGAACDVAIDFTFPDAVKTNVAGAGAARHQHRHRHDRLGRPMNRRFASAVADAGIGVVAAPNFSVGVVLFEAIVARAAALFAAQQRVRRLPARSASRREEGRAVGHGAAAQAGDGGGRLHEADRRVVHPRRLHSRDAYRRLRRPGRDNRPVARGPRSHRRLRAGRSLRQSGWHGRRGWFTMKDVLGV